MNFAIVVVGGSAGSLSALKRLAGDLPADLPAAVFVATHISPHSVSAMPHILGRCGPFFATHAIDGAPISPGRIFIAPPNYHLAIERGYMRVTDWDKEHGQRPAIDVLFRTAAAAYGTSVCGVLLSGTLDDGVAGLVSIKEAGGLAIVQDPADALFPDMPRHALEAQAADVVVPSNDLGAAVAQGVKAILRIAAGESVPDATFSCPGCESTLSIDEQGGEIRFRCRNGHAYTVNGMLDEQSTNLENSLQAALRILDNRIDLVRRMAARARERGETGGEGLEKHAEDLVNDSQAIRRTLVDVAYERRLNAS